MAITPTMRIPVVLPPSFLMQSRLVLGHADEYYRMQTCGYFRALGLDTAAAQSAEEVYELAHRIEPAVIVLGIDLPDESGYLTCAKLKAVDPDCRVILVGKKPIAAQERFAEFVGAEALVAQTRGLEALGDQVLGAALAAAC